MNWNRKEFIRTLGMAAATGFVGLRNNTDVLSPNGDTLIKPRRLKLGDTIGLVSPASILPEEQRYDEIADTISGLGFRVKIGSNARNRYGNLAGRDEERAEDLNLMFSDPDVDAIIPFRGGWGSNRILEMIDFDNIRNNPKPLIGFSDITSLLLAIYSKTGLVTFHGPVGKSEWNDFTKSNFEQVLMSDRTDIFENPFDSEVSVQTITPGTAQGRLLGGNLTVLTSMLGSDYLPEWDNAILFLEDVGEDVYRIDRMLTQLKLNGILEKISGFIFGRCTNCERGNNYSLKLEQVLKDHIQVLGTPSFYGSMIGHIDNMFTLPIGISSEMDATSGSIKLLEVPTSNHNK